ncbi:hypothetical protein [Lentzea sp. NPDC092896]|uniref:hypothetical protein n=1 Tax=Lentzea sp. NPDC092896 TaxID=3364127 RepID=UPI0037FC7025
MTAHAVWNDGREVTVPSDVLATFEVAYGAVQIWSIARQYPDPLHNDPGFLDHVEQALAEEVVRGAVKAGRALLTNSGPAWSVRPASYADFAQHVDFSVATESREWQRGTRLPYLRGHGPTWLMCRMSGLSIPLLPHEVKP